MDLQPTENTSLIYIQINQTSLLALRQFDDALLKKKLSENDCLYSFSLCFDEWKVDEGKKLDSLSKYEIC